MKGRERTVLLAGIGFQIVVLLAMIAPRIMTLTTGDTILLHVEPVDPRDLFRGDYVILSYEFSRLPRPGIPGLLSSDPQGKTVYVTLEPEEDGRHWRASNFSLRKPSNGKFLQGKITNSNQIEFGIESYFVQEGEGPKYERSARNRSLSAEVALDKKWKSRFETARG